MYFYLTQTTLNYGKSQGLGGLEGWLYCCVGKPIAGREAPGYWFSQIIGALLHQPFRQHQKPLNPLGLSGFHFVLTTPLHDYQPHTGSERYSIYYIW